MGFGGSGVGGEVEALSKLHAFAGVVVMGWVTHLMLLVALSLHLGLSQPVMFALIGLAVLLEVILHIWRLNR